MLLAATSLCGRNILHLRSASIRRVNTITGSQKTVYMSREQNPPENRGEKAGSRGRGRPRGRGGTSNRLCHEHNLTPNCLLRKASQREHECEYTGQTAADAL